MAYGSSASVTPQRNARDLKKFLKRVRTGGVCAPEPLSAGTGPVEGIVAVRDPAAPLSLACAEEVARTRQKRPPRREYPPDS